MKNWIIIIVLFFSVIIARPGKCGCDRMHGATSQNIVLGVPAFQMNYSQDNQLSVSCNDVDQGMCELPENTENNFLDSHGDNNDISFDLTYIDGGPTPVQLAENFEGGGPGTLIPGAKTLSSMAIFPNPASTYTSVDFTFTSKASQVAYLRVYDLMGKQLSHIDIEESSGSYKINLRNFNEGVYFCSLIVNGETLVTKRFIVSRTSSGE